MKYLSLLFMVGTVHTAFAGDPCTPPGSPLSTPPSPRLERTEASQTPSLTGKRTRESSDDGSTPAKQACLYAVNRAPQFAPTMTGKRQREALDEEASTPAKQARLRAVSTSPDASSPALTPSMDMGGAQNLIKRLAEQNKIKKVNGSIYVAIDCEDDFEKVVDALVLTNTKVRVFDFFAPKDYKTELPERICDLASLVELHLNGTYTRIPKNIENLKNLKTFFSTGPMNVEGPFSNIAQLSQLTSFSFLSDTLSVCPDFIEHMPNLRTLSIGQATHLTPWSVSTPKYFPDHLASAPSLVTLSLQSHMKAVPAFLSRCVNLAYLVIGSTIKPMHVPGAYLTSLIVRNAQSNYPQSIIIESPLLDPQGRLYIGAPRPVRSISVRSPLSPRYGSAAAFSRLAKFLANTSSGAVSHFQMAFSIDGQYINCAEDFRNIDIRSGWVTIAYPSAYLKSLGIQHGTRIFCGFREEWAQGLYDYTKDIPAGTVIQPDWSDLSRIFIFENMIENDQKEANIAKATRILTDVMNQLAFEKFKQDVSEAA